ncbi:MAG TPA: transporter substrate-binding domain-containing protein [Anaerolineales bacterium]|nr:transporter substrate-binding domain-containing protein [Anaerolineales bacterium]
MKRLIRITTALLALSLMVAACQTAAPTAAPDLLADVLSRGILRVSTDPNYAPQSFLNDQGQLDGFDVDVAKEVAKRLGVTVEFVTPDWDTITAGHWGDRWDISIGSMTPTEERAQVLSFTEPYYYSPAQFAVLNSSTLATVQELNGKSICAAAATTYESYLQNNGSLSLIGESIIYQVTGAQVVTYPTDQECAQAWASGRMDFEAWLTNSTTIFGAQEGGIQVKKLGDPVYYEALAVAIDKSASKDPASLVAKLSEIITAMRNDGTLTALSMKWYKVDLARKVGQ